MKFKIFLKKELECSGLKKWEFANKIGVSRLTLGKYLSGDTSPNFDKAVEIANTLGKKVQIIDEYKDK